MGDCWKLVGLECGGNAFFVGVGVKDLKFIKLIVEMKVINVCLLNVGI